MKIYTYDPAPNPQRLAFFMKYKGIEIETQQVDMMTGEQLGEEYRAITPACTLPALVTDDGAVMTEVIGQCVYLEELYPEKPLLGTTALEKAQIISWDHHLYTNVFSGVAEMLRNKSRNFANRAMPGPLDLPQIPELIDRGRMKIEHAWPVLDAELANRPWLAGDNFSLADIDLFILTNFAGWVKQSAPEECKHLHDFIARAQAELA